MVQDAFIWAEDAFYVWNFNRPTSPWFYAMSFLLVVGVTLVTLFPLAPWGAAVMLLGDRLCP